MPQTRLSYQDYRPIRKGEMGYSPTARRYISPSTGNIISVREFQKKAHGGQRYEQRVPQAARKPYQRSAKRYTSKDIENLLKAKPSQLTSYQKKLVRQYSRPQQISDVARATGADPLALLRATYNANIRSDSIRHLRGQWVARTPGGATKYLLKISSEGGTTYRWYTARGAQAVLDEVARETNYPEMGGLIIEYVA